MSWKNERQIHIRGEAWAWVPTQDWGARVRAPDGTTHEFGYKEITGEDFDVTRIGLPDELGLPGITPGGVKAAVLKHLVPHPDPEHERYDLIGDVHGCFDELMDLMDRLGHKWVRRLGIHRPAGGRKIVFVGDLVDRGPRSATTFMYAMYMVREGYAVWVEGNHDNKLKRWAKGNKVTLNHGLAKTVHQLETAGASKAMIYDFLKTLPLYAVLDYGRLIAVHGSWYEGLESEKRGKIRARCLYGQTTGEIQENGLPVRIDWAGHRKAHAESPMIVYGHQPYEEARLINGTAGIDTGCCFGGKLTALRWPEQEIVQVPAAEVWDKEGRALNGFGG